MARNFDGLSGNVNCGSGASLDDIKAAGGFTVSAWIYPDTMGEGSVGVIAGKASSANTLGWLFRFVNTNAIQFAHTGSIILVRASNNNVITLGVWQHVLVTWDGSTTAANVHIYLNGSEVAYATTTNGSVLDTDAAQNFIIGNNAGDSRTWDGSIAEVNIWNAVINANEITALSRGVSPIRVRPGSSLKGYWPLWGATSPEPDYSGNQNNGTVTGAAVAAHAPNIAPAFGFDSDWRGAFTAAAAAGHPAMRRHGMIHYGRPFTSNFRKVA